MCLGLRIVATTVSPRLDQRLDDERAGPPVPANHDHPHRILRRSDARSSTDAGPSQAATNV